MNKYDAFIHDYLTQNKQVTLEKIGVLQITADQKQPDNSATPVVQFTYDRKAETDPLLLDHIAEKAGKNRALVAADLSSYLEQVRQFINIGKPYVIPGIGAVFMLKNSYYDFSQQAGANFASSPVTQVIPEHYLEANAEEVGRIRKKNSLAGVAVLVVVLVAAGIGWWIFNSVKGGKTTEPEMVKQDVVLEDSAIPPGESSAEPPPVTKRPDTTATVQPVASAVPNNSGGFKFIFETTPSGDRARARTEQLQSFGDPAQYDSVTRNGATTYRLYFAHKVGPADTALIRDTLQRYFQRPVIVE